MKEYDIAESLTKTSMFVESIRHGIVIYSLKPIFIWNDGEILFYNLSKLLWYNPEMNMFMVDNVDGDVITSTKYIPNFYSLETIMGDDFQVSSHKCLS